MGETFGNRKKYPLPKEVCIIKITHYNYFGRGTTYTCKWIPSITYIKQEILETRNIKNIGIAKVIEGEKEGEIFQCCFGSDDDFLYYCVVKNK